MNKLRESLTKHFEEALEVLLKRKQELMEELDRIERRLAESTDLDDRFRCRITFNRSILQVLRHMGRLVLDAKSALTPARETLFSSKPLCLHSPQGEGALLVATDDSENTFSILSAKRDKVAKTFGCRPPLSTDLAIGGVARLKDKIIVSVFNKDILYVLSSDGQFEKTLGSSGRGKDQFLGPCDLSTHGDNLFVCERDNSRVQVLRNNTHSHFIGWYDNRPGALRKPRSVCVGPKSEVFVLHAGITSIVVYSISGEPRACFGAGELRDSSRLGVSSNGDVIVCGGGAGSLYCFHHNLTTCFVYPSDVNTSFHKPWDVCVDKSGDIVLTDPNRLALLSFNLSDAILW